MGYYTNFSLAIRTAITKAKAREIIGMINRICTQSEDEDDWAFVLEDDWFSTPSLKTEDKGEKIWNIVSRDEMKWYDWEDDMKDIAHQYPEVEFELEGSGEDKDDWWIALFKGNRSQVKYCTAPIDEWED
jgi:hypothetical protein